MYLCQIGMIAEADVFFEILHHTLKLSKPFVTLYQISVTFAPPAAASFSKSLSFFRVEASSHHYKFSETQNHSRFSSDCSGCLCCIFLPPEIFSPPIKTPQLFSNGLSITDDIDSCKSPKACFQFQPCGPRTLAFGQKAGESSVHLMEVKLLRNTSGVLLIKLFM